jgi:type II secretory pathway pseudopilin PulG
MRLSPPGSRHAEAGYNLVVLAVAITVLNIMVAAMLPLWSTAIRREKEEELIFRGFQYAEAIRVFRIRNNGRLPNKLEELIEVKPRSIRQLWKDPMTDDGKWVLIFQNQPQGLPKQPNPNPNGRNQPEEEKDDEGPLQGRRKGEVVQVGPIIGVHSRSGKKSMLVFFGRERYDEWQFTEAQLLGGAPPPDGAGGAPQQWGGAQFSTRWLGRPMRGFNQQPGGALPQDGNLPDGSTPGGTRPPKRPQTTPGGPAKPR